MSLVLQAGAIAVRHRAATAEVLIVRAKRNPADWIFPKGHVEPGEDDAAAAERELLEEGGVVGRADRLVGTTRFTLGSRDIQVSYYLVWFIADGVATEAREKAWLPLEEARARLSFDDLRQLVDAIATMVATAPGDR